MVTVSLKNEVSFNKKEFAGEYQISETVNGKPSWKSGENAIWLFGNNWIIGYGDIQQLRGQVGGEGGSAKSPRLSTQGGGSQDVHVDKNFKKGTEESWQMTMKILISSIFVQL